MISLSLSTSVPKNVTTKKAIKMSGYCAYID